MGASAALIASALIAAGSAAYQGYAQEEASSEAKSLAERQAAEGRRLMEQLGGQISQFLGPGMKQVPSGAKPISYKKWLASQGLDETKATLPSVKEMQKRKYNEYLNSFPMFKQVPSKEGLVYTPQLLNRLTNLQKQAVYGNTRERIKNLNQSLALRGMGKSGKAEELLLKLQMQKAGNLAAQQSALHERAALTNRQALENYFNLLSAVKSKQVAATQPYNLAALQLTSQAPWAGTVGQFAKGATGLGGMIYGQEQKNKRFDALMGMYAYNLLKNRANQSIRQGIPGMAGAGGGFF